MRKVRSSGKPFSDVRRTLLGLPSGIAVRLSVRKRSDITRAIIEEFCSRFALDGQLVYVRDTSKQNRSAYLDEEIIERLGTSLERAIKWPDVVIYLAQKNWLFLVEALDEKRPVDSERLKEIKSLFAESNAHLIVVTAARNRQEMSRQLTKVAWGTHVWLLDAPDHMIHFSNSGPLH